MTHSFVLCVVCELPPPAHLSTSSLTHKDPWSVGETRTKERKGVREWRIESNGLATSYRRKKLREILRERDGKDTAAYREVGKGGGV